MHHLCLWRDERFTSKHQSPIEKTISSRERGRVWALYNQICWLKDFSGTNFATELEANDSNMFAGIQEWIGISLDLSICSLRCITFQQTWMRLRRGFRRMCGMGEIPAYLLSGWTRCLSSRLPAEQRCGELGLCKEAICSCAVTF